MHQPTKFNFFIPADFSKSGENGEMKISGICSSKTEDTDGETLDPSGFDFSPLLEKGYFNWNHQANKSADAIIGRPTEAKVVNGGNDLWVGGVLYKGSEQARAVYNLAKTLEAEDPTRRLGFSIEGHATDRDPINPKRIRKAVISHIAITHCPKNSNTLLTIMKGEYSEPFVEVEEIKSEVEVPTDTIEKSRTPGAKDRSKRKSIDHHYNELSKLQKTKEFKDYLKSHDYDEDERNPEDWEEDSKGYDEGHITHKLLAHYKHIVGDDSELDKSMDTSNTPLPESVDGKPKSMVEDDKIKDTVEKSEGSRGELEKGNAKQSERILGKTKSGKEVYESTGHKSHYAFDKDDHEDASELHMEEAGMLWKLGKKDEAFTSARRAENHKARAKKTPKSTDKKELKKSEIFNQIFSKYTTNIEKSEQIYNFVKSVNEKINPMAIEITDDVLSKAFELLDESLIKGGDEKDKASDYDTKDELIKNGGKKPFDKEAEDDAKSQIAEGKGEKEVCDDMMAKGYDMSETQTAVSKLCAEYTANKDGGAGTGEEVHVDSVSKGEIQEMLDGLSKGIEQKFSALSTILKSQLTENSELKKSIETVSLEHIKETDTLKKSIEQISSTPFPKKSVTNLSVLEKFQKSEGAEGRQVYRLGDTNDRNNLVTFMFNKAVEFQQLGRPNAGLEKAISDLEITKSMSGDMLPLLNSWGIQVAE